MPLKDSDIKKAIGVIIENSLTSLYAGQTIKPVVKDHWQLSLNIGEAASALRAREGKLKGKIHGWMIGLDGFTRMRLDVKDAFIQNAVNGSLRKVGPNQRVIFRTYRVWGFHPLEVGTLGAESDSNSEARLVNEMETIADAISLRPSLDLNDNLAQWVYGHTELDFKTVDTFAFGQDQVNLAQGTLTVITYKPIQL